METSPRRTSRLAFVVIPLALACACSSGNSKAERGAPATGLGIVPASMDRSVQAGDDFFAYANGTWVKNTPIPDDRSSVGGFYIADKERERQTRELLDAILKSNPAPGTNDAKIANYYDA